MNERVRLGELLVDTGLITREQLEGALLQQKASSPPRRLGELLVDLGVVTESQVTQVLSQQLSVPWVSLQYIDFSRQLLNLVPAVLAEKYGIVPIYVRRARNRQETLYVAMQDPTDTGPLAELEEHSGLPVRPMIAPPTDIKAAIRAYYLGLPPEEEVDPVLETQRASLRPQGLHERGFSTRPAPPASARAATAPPSAAPSSAPAPAQSSALHAADDEPPSSEAPLHSRGATMPRARGADLPRMVTLTMLDGTEIALPAAGRRRRPRHEAAAAKDELTARDLIEALRAAGGGADTSEVLAADVNWQNMCAALLAILLRKHLIHDWEFVRELRR